MKLIYTLLLLLISFSSVGQLADTSKVVVIGNCWGAAKKKDTAKVDLQKGLAGKNLGLNVVTVNNAPARIILRCGRRPVSDSIPMLVVNGIPVPLGFINMLNPNDIEEVTVLKIPAATAIYGPDGVNGAIIITMKRTFTVRDFFDNKPIPGATVTFISNNKKDTVVFVANDSGRVVMNKLPEKNYSMQVSSIGYKTIERSIVNNSDHPKNIFLTRDIQQCKEVVLSATQCWKRRICCGYIVRKSMKHVDQTVTAEHGSKLKTYPNPVSKGAPLTIQWKDLTEAINELRIITLDGKIMLRQPVTNKGTTGQMQVPADSRWAAGIYFLQVTCEKGRVLASEKIIIQ